MKSNLIAAAVLAVSTLGAVSASAETFNSWAFDQAAVPSTKTRAEVKAEVIQASKQQQAVRYGALAQPVAAPAAVQAPVEARSAGLVKTTGQTAQ